MQRRLTPVQLLFLAALPGLAQDTDPAVQILNEDLEVRPLTDTLWRVVSTRDMGEGWGRVPDEKVLFGGCLIKSAGARGMGYIEEADLEAWLETLGKVRTEFADAAVIVPGHGSPGGEETLRRTAELIEEHQREVQFPSGKER